MIAGYLKLRGQQLKTIIYICIYIYGERERLCGNCKPKIYNRSHTIRKCNPNTTLNIVIKSQEKRAIEEGKGKKQQKQI